MLRITTPLKSSAMAILLSLLFPIIIFGDEATNTQYDSAYAYVVDVSLPASLLGDKPRSLTIDLPLYEQDSVSLGKQGAVDLLLRDGSVARFEGPATILVSQVKPREGNLLARLPKALMSLLFAEDQESGDARLAVRDPMANQSRARRVPRLTSPPPGAHLMRVPTVLAWEEIEGVYQYRVRLFDSTQLLFDKRVNTPYVRLPEHEELVASGGAYLWVVQAELGDEALSSLQANFEVMTKEFAEAVTQYIAEVDRSVDNPRLAALLRLKIYRDFGLSEACFREIEGLLEEYPEDRLALRAKATMLQQAGEFQAAAEIYRELLED